MLEKKLYVATLTGVELGGGARGKFLWLSFSGGGKFSPPWTLCHPNEVKRKVEKVFPEGTKIMPRRGENVSG